MAQNPSEFYLSYPREGHETTADRIFFIGTAPLGAEVQINGQPVIRSAVGHFAPSFPLQVGTNRFVVQWQDQRIERTVIRHGEQQSRPQGWGFVPGSLEPSVDIARLPGEWVCFSAIASPAKMEVYLGDRQIDLRPSSLPNLSPNQAVLIGQKNPNAESLPTKYEGCITFSQPGFYGKPRFDLVGSMKTVREMATGAIEILSPDAIQVAEVTANAAVARTGPSTDYSRLTPLPKGTRARITGRQGEWLRLDYGGWIRQREAAVSSATALPHTLIRGVQAKSTAESLEVFFPLQVPVPIAVRQGDRQFSLTLYNTTAQTDITRLDQNPIVSLMDWQQIAPNQVQYTFTFKQAQQWGYRLRYEGNTLVLSLRYPPQLGRDPARPLAGIKILLDPGHGGPEDLGARGPTGYPEKAVTLRVSQLLQAELLRRGATVVMTRDADIDLDLPPRVALIEQTSPTIALSLHYNALPDDGDALNTQGVGIFWFHPQSHGLAQFLHNYLVEKLDRPSYGVFWHNLALTRPTIAPTVLLELGFMIHPQEFEWIVNPEAQQRLAITLADGITAWLNAP